MFTAFLAIALNATAIASPGTLKVITNVRSSAVCATLRRNVFQAVQGLRVNDGLIEQGKLILEKIGYDAKAQPESVSIVGGAGGASQMDDMQLELLVHDLAENLDKIDALLSEAQAFPDASASTDERKLLQAKSRLEAVAERQREALNLLSGTAETNELLDLQSRRNPVDASFHPPIAQRVSSPETMQSSRTLLQRSEEAVTPALLPVIAVCR